MNICQIIAQNNYGFSIFIVQIVVVIQSLVLAPFLAHFLEVRSRDAQITTFTANFGQQKGVFVAFPSVFPNWAICVQISARQFVLWNFWKIKIYLKNWNFTFFLVRIRVLVFTFHTDHGAHFAAEFALVQHECGCFLAFLACGPYTARGVLVEAACEIFFKYFYF